MKRFFAILGFLALAAPVCAQQSQGPLTPPPDKEVRKIKSSGTPAPPPVPVEEIVKRFTANETAFLHAYKAYTYQQTIRVQEFDQDKSAGEFQVKGEVYIRPNGEQYERVSGQPASTLHRIKLSVEDLETLANLPLFSLTTEQADRYNFTYEGTQQLDELNTYIFRVEPKRMEHRQRYFSGVVWVDDHDFGVVRSYGHFVIDTQPEGEPLPFSMFEVTRENVDGKYWFPTYTRSDDTLHTRNGEIPIRLTVRSTDFKVASAASATAGTPASPPKSPRP